MLTLLTSLALANGTPRTTGRTPIGEMQVKTERVRMVHEDLEIRLMSLDEYEVRATYQLFNPGADEVVRFAVPITSGGKDGGFRDSNAAASVRVLSDGTFVPCLIEEAPGFETPYAAGVIDRWCSADLTVPSGASEIRLSYEGALLYSRDLPADALVPTGADRTLAYALQPAGSWAKKPDEIAITVDLGPYASRATVAKPEKGDVSGRIVSWSLDKPDLDKTPWLEIGLQAADWDQHAIAATLNAHPNKRWTPTASTTAKEASPIGTLTDADPATAWCGKSGATLQLDWPAVEAPNPAEGCRAGIGVIPGDASSEKRWAETAVEGIGVKVCGAESGQTATLKRAATPEKSGQVLMLDAPMNDAFFDGWRADPPSETGMCVEVEATGPGAEVCLAELAWRVRCD